MAICVKNLTGFQFLRLKIGKVFLQLSRIHGFFFSVIATRIYRAELIPVQNNGISKRIDDKTS